MSEAHPVILFVDLLGVRARWLKGGRGAAEAAFKKFRNMITPRVIAQAGLFTIHPNPKEPFVSPMLSKRIIKQEFRRKLKYFLNKYGVNRATMFPGLDGLAKHITWRKTDEY